MLPPSLARRAAQRHVLLFSAFAALLVLLLTAHDPVARADDPAPGSSDSAGTRRVFLAFVSAGPQTVTTGEQYELVPVSEPPSWCPTDTRPAALHADKNLGLRGYSLTTIPPLTLVDYTGATDPGAPQMPGIFEDARTPQFTSAYRVYDWNWSCGADGCRGNLLTYPPVTLLGLGAHSGEFISFPSRGAEIYGGGYVALVLYAEPGRLTLKYTREDTVCDGYTVHLENLSVDTNLLSLYLQANASGRGWLPAVKNGQRVGAAFGKEVLVAIRDKGTFMDPRSRKDWWQGR